jgi:hypothetical protein
MPFRYGYEVCTINFKKLEATFWGVDALWRLIPPCSPGPYGRRPTGVTCVHVVKSAYILQHTSVCWFQGSVRVVRPTCRPCRLSPDLSTQTSTPGCGGGVCIPVPVTVSLSPLPCVMSIALEMHARLSTLSTQSCRRRHSTTVDVCHFRRPAPEANFFWGVPV